MYTDEDLNNAVDKGIFTASSVDEFRRDQLLSKRVTIADEENIRLIGGFNDIFIVIACALLLFSSLWVVKSIDPRLGLATFAALSWALAEFFVLKRKMAFPAIMLLLAFIGGVFKLSIEVFAPLGEQAMVVATGASVIAAFCHWRRFNVPITIAAGTAAMIGFIVSSFISTFTTAETINVLTDWILVVIFTCGILTFLFAMYWDSSDRERVTNRTDTAFWLHLLSAPLIIHPIFLSVGILNGDESISSIAIIIALYLLMSLVSIIIDRRAFMVSSLVYVLYALSSLMSMYGDVGTNFAITGVAIGAALLLLSALWHPVRGMIVTVLPSAVKQLVPDSK
ncbi:MULTISPECIES: hypothetical protein [unclassified Moritella]|uniref:hypothetical protein n=1 Tax=unclassified Moritella TaxID=2637987 RepID=UPI001BA9C76A|nr:MULTISPECIES: hypothetical protein [unclassified Moritella]QUM84638.1 hypothetical protein HWV02_09035 [Moritella sp. 28]QUM88883.1 hypothetical protein HWV03_08770 [Moritella sp. 36]